MRCSTRDGKLHAWQSFEDGKPVAIQVSKNVVTQLLCVAYPLQNSTGSTYMNQSVQISISSALRFVVYLLSWHAVYGGKTFSHWLLCRRDKKLIQFCVLQHRQCRSLWLLPVLISSHCHCTARSAMNVKMNISAVNSKKTNDNHKGGWAGICALSWCAPCVCMNFICEFHTQFLSQVPMNTPWSGCYSKLNGVLPLCNIVLYS